jgi:hypothetical protein
MNKFSPAKPIHPTKILCDIVEKILTLCFLSYENVPYRPPPASQAACSKNVTELDKQKRRAIIIFMSGTGTREPIQQTPHENLYRSESPQPEKELISEPRAKN